MSKTEVNEEYIEDRSIADAGEDSFRHADVVAELADLALEGPAPSNIALFAPWGTGKSGIAKLLEPRIRSAKQRFVYFDAFKHRETPLRRSFLRAVVSELDPGALASIDTRLYGERTTQTLNESDKKKLFWMILGGVLGALALAGLVSLGLSKLHPGALQQRLSRAVCEDQWGACISRRAYRCRADFAYQWLLGNPNEYSCGRGR